MRRIALAGGLCVAGLVGAFLGAALGQSPRMPPAESKGFRTELLATLADSSRSTTTATGQASSTFRKAPLPSIRKAPIPASMVPDRPLLSAFTPGTGRRTEGPVGRS
jgi:hypothetical protein